MALKNMENTQHKIQSLMLQPMWCNNNPMYNISTIYYKMFRWIKSDFENWLEYIVDAAMGKHSSSL